MIESMVIPSPAAAMVSSSLSDFKQGKRKLVEEND